MANPALIAVAAGGLSATAWLSAAFGLPGGLFLSYLAPLPLLWVGLTAGLPPVIIGGVAGMVVAGLLMGLAAAQTYLGVHALPAAIIIALCLLKRPIAAADGQPSGQFQVLSPGAVLAHLAIISAGGLVALALFETTGESIEASVREFVERLITAAPTGDETAVTPLAVLAPLAPVFLGFLAMAWQMMIVVNIVLAQWAATKAGRALRPTPRWSQVAIPDWLSWPLAGAALLALVSDGNVAYLAQNAALGLAVPYFFAGLAAVHRFAGRSGARRLLLFVFYLLLVVMFIFMVVFVTALGIIDQWFIGRRAGTPRIVKRSD
jgi:hypothetical protein